MDRDLVHHLLGIDRVGGARRLFGSSQPIVVTWDLSSMDPRRETRIPKRSRPLHLLHSNISDRREIVRICSR